MLALREVLLSRWAVVGRQAQGATLQLLTQMALAQLAADPRPLLRAQVNATVAAIIKRGWLERSPQERDAALQAIHAQVRCLGCLGCGSACREVAATRSMRRRSAEALPLLPTHTTPPLRACAAPLLQASQVGTLEARRAGLELLTAVVEEFSPTTASQMGLSWCAAWSPCWMIRRSCGGSTGHGVSLAPPPLSSPLSLPTVWLAGSCTSSAADHWRRAI